ncbi:hypothetical protein SAMN05444171_5521 [Bradyrhizobium lablabi]|jgi:hypothetical protein|uniref:Uncharacterized protein n=2 Tax=Bradyrhizobium TaxID=374 RepID=A0ABY0PBR2_9BRAD|nr:hypothetical protein SAMN05444163_1650 [Bradyrhizobium ottawaense]SED88335.1 hypothetical protein SAMN05444171_5521 [Bradyrhizobium lablabi]SHL84718.1 hypothetical protein SAMN05444321_4312 [Bradyrhizobium lablabi]
MTRLVPSVIAVLVAIGAATSVLKSHSLFPFGGTGMPPVQEIRNTDQLGRLPVQDFDDRSLVFPRDSTQ